MRALDTVLWILLVAAPPADGKECISIDDLYRFDAPTTVWQRFYGHSRIPAKKTIQL